MLRFGLGLALGYLVANLLRWQTSRSFGAKIIKTAAFIRRLWERIKAYGGKSPAKTSNQEKIRWLLFLIAALAAPALMLLYVAIFWSTGPAGTTWGGSVAALFLGLLPNFITITAAFAIGYAVLERKGILGIVGAQANMSLANLKDFHISHNQVKWDEIYQDARHIDIGVFYYKHLAEGPYFPKLVNFFERGGSMRLIFLDPEDQALLSVASHHFFGGMPTQTLSERIMTGTANYETAFEKAASSKSKLEVWHFEKLFHYTFTLVDKRYLYLSAYAQFEPTPELLSPVVVIDLMSDAALSQYWDEQLSHFFAASHQRGQPKRNELQPTVGKEWPL